MSCPLSVLIIEDSPDDMQLLLRELKRNGYEVTYQCVESARELSAALESQSWDIILSDYSLPSFSAPAALQLVREKGLDVPFIIISGTVGEDVAVTAMKAGAQDFFAKGKLVRLAPAIERELAEAQERKNRRLAEQQLHHSEERYRKLFENANDIIYTLDMHGCITSINRAGEKLSGYSREELLQKPLTDLATPDSQERMQEMLANKLNGEPLTAYEVELVAKGGEKKILEVSSRLMFEENTPVGIQGIARDVTERKAAEAELHALYNATSYLFRADNLADLGHQIVQGVVAELGQIDCGLLLVDAKQKQLLRLARVGTYDVTASSPLFLDGTGLVPEAIRSNKLIYVPDVRASQVYAPNDPRTASELVVPLQTGNGVLGALDLQSTQLDAFSQRDQRIITAFAERAAAAIEIVKLYEEVNQYAAELELRVYERTAQLELAKERVEAILNSSSTAIALLNAEGMIQQCNPAFEQLLGYDPDMLFARPISFLVHKDNHEPLAELLAALRKTDLPESSYIDLYQQDGTLLPVEITLSPIVTTSGLVQGIVCSLYDLRLHKQIEEHLLKSVEHERQLNSMKTRFISMVSHEFRTPLSAIMLSTDILKKYDERLSSEQKQAKLNSILGQITHMNQLIEDVLLLGRVEIGTLRFEPKNLHVFKLIEPIVEDLRETIGITHNIRLSTSGDAQTAETALDAKLIRQIVTNLISNAIKYSPKGSTIQVDLSVKSDEIMFSVADQGIGIPEKDQKQLFATFHRASNTADIPGNGLGLMLTKMMVELHDGSISFVTAENVGTTFTISIPRKTLP